MNFSERFLKAKHWQLFLYTFGILIVPQLIMMMISFISIINQTEINQIVIIGHFAMTPTLTLVSLTILFGWFWAIGIGLQNKLPENVTLNTGRFKFFFTSALVYFLFFITLFFISVLGIFPSDKQNTLRLFFVIVPLHLFSMICMFYCLYFVAKTFKTVELQRDVTFSDFAGEFFLIWFYPIGIWTLQPKINELAKNK